MAGIFSVLGISDTERVMVQTVGQRVVYDAVQQVLQEYNDGLSKALGVFVGESTSDYKLRYKLPGGGRLQRRGGQAPSGAVKAYGSWDVAFPLEDFGAQVAGDRVSMAYMTLKDLQNHLDSVMIRDINTMRFEILKALLNNVQDTFTDPLYGSLSIEPLANGDTVVYPPVLGAEDEATDDHYLESGYAYTAITDTNNPLVTMRNELEEHFGAPTGGSNIVVFINNEETPYIEALSSFDAVTDRFIRAGEDTDEPIGLPFDLPGKILGRCDGVWVVEWRYIPAKYMVGIHLDAPAPLIQRVDPEDTGLPRGLALVSESGDANYPFTQSQFVHRFGFGAGNRLNGVVMELGSGGSYGIPTGYD